MERELKHLGGRGLQRRLKRGEISEIAEAMVGEEKKDFPAEKRLMKALALALHEVLWVLDLGGSCPLICGNCSDTPTPTEDDPGIPRCASKGKFGNKVIHIGMH
jgi:hypothetical protein